MLFFIEIEPLRKYDIITFSKTPEHKKGIKKTD